MHAPSLGGLVVGFALLAVVFSGIERLFPAVPGVSIFRRDRLPDYVYWFFTPLVTRVLSNVALFLAIALVAGALGVEGHGAELPPRVVAALTARSPIAGLGAGAQLGLALLVGDFIGYWTHRAFHTRRLWRFHAVHHSSEMLDWLAATRVHPVDDVLSKLAKALPILLLGADPKVFAAATPILTFYAIFEHANVPWGLGPLRYVIATPLFHRWHHTSESEGLDKNFAGMFPFFDVLFGTFHLPPGAQPARFGVTGSPVPRGFFGQLAYPFRREAG